MTYTLTVAESKNNTVIKMMLVDDSRTAQKKYRMLRACYNQYEYTINVEPQLEVG